MRIRLLWIDFDETIENRYSERNEDNIVPMCHN